MANLANLVNLANLAIYQYLPTFHAWGIRLTLIPDAHTLNPSTRIVPEPQDILTDELRYMLRAHREDIIREVQQFQSSGATILWVASDLTHWEDTDPRYGYEIDCEPTYRMLDPPYYAWLYAQMERLKQAHTAGNVSANTYEASCVLFREVHAWAVKHLGKEAMDNALRTTNVRAYVPPSPATLAEYRALWAAARRENSERLTGGVRALEGRE